MVGLTDRHIGRRNIPDMGQGLAGHERYDSLYVLAQRPRYIILPQRKHMGVRVNDDMQAQPVFQRDYFYDGLAFRRRD